MPGRVSELPKVEGSTDPALEHKASGFDKGLAWVRVRFRDVNYKFVELTLGEHNTIEKECTVTKADPAGGPDIEALDQSMQNRRMILASMVEPGRDDPNYLPIDRWGTRLFLTIQRVVQGLHYLPEEDQFKKRPEALGNTGNEEDATKGNG